MVIFLGPLLTLKSQNGCSSEEQELTFGAILADNNLRKGSLACPVQIWINNARASWKDHQIYHSLTAVAENYYNVDDMITDTDQREDIGIWLPLL